MTSLASRPRGRTGNQTLDPDELRNHALELLRIHAEVIERERRGRVVVIRLARAYGFSNQQIADHLGVTEGAVRHTITRAEATA